MKKPTHVSRVDRATNALLGTVAFVVCSGVPFILAAEELVLRTPESEFEFSPSSTRRADSSQDRDGNDLAAFGTGITEGRVRLTVRKHLRRFGSEPPEALLLVETVPSLPGSDFRPNERLLQMLQSDGALSRPPASSNDDRQRQAQRWFDSAWKAATARIQEGDAPTPSEQTDARRSLAVWQSAMSSSDRRRSVAIASWFRDASRLVEGLSDSRRIERMRNRMTGFPGGTVADLTAWLLENDMSVKSNSVGQISMSRLAAGLARNARPVDADISADLSTSTLAGISPEPIGEPAAAGEQSFNPDASDSVSQPSEMPDGPGEEVVPRRSLGRPSLQPVPDPDRSPQLAGKAAQ